MKCVHTPKPVRLAVFNQTCGHRDGHVQRVGNMKTEGKDGTLHAKVALNYQKHEEKQGEG